MQFDLLDQIQSVPIRTMMNIWLSTNKSTDENLIQSNEEIFSFNKSSNEIFQGQTKERTDGSADGRTGGPARKAGSGEVRADGPGN